jgi:hypothetical protein
MRALLAPRWSLPENLKSRRESADKADIGAIRPIRLLRYFTCQRSEQIEFIALLALPGS